jgi:uncharacterized protein (TIGR00369 family)
MQAAKTPRETRLTMAYRVMPQDTNPAGNLHGGVILRYIDLCAGTVAMRHARGNVVTASLDRMDFIKPVFVGELVILHANLNMVGRTSMEVGVRVEAENLYTGETRWTNSAYLTFVALDEHGKPKQVPPLKLETEEDERRNREAGQRRDTRVKQKQTEQESQRAMTRSGLSIRG